MPPKKKKQTKKEVKTKLLKIEKFKIFNDNDLKELKYERVKSAIAQLDFERLFFLSMLLLFFNIIDS